MLAWGIKLDDELVALAVQLTAYPYSRNYSLDLLSLLLLHGGHSSHSLACTTDAFSNHGGDLVGGVTAQSPTEMWRSIEASSQSWPLFLTTWNWP